VAWTYSLLGNVVCAIRITTSILFHLDVLHLDSSVNVIGLIEMHLYLNVPNDWRELDDFALKILLYALLDKQKKLNEYLKEVIDEYLSR
jgi:hypothetical protein